MSGGLYRLKTA